MTSWRASSVSSSTSTWRHGIPDAITETLHRVWGFSTFRPLQREAMDAILASRDSVVVLPTGGGKSLCFQAPAVSADRGLALVISPLISLMKDQVDGLRVDGVAAAYLNSTLQAREREAMDAILASRDSVVVLPTGGGKSLCFQAPAVSADRGLALVISPLISLMKDQVDGLRVDGVAAAYLNSTLQARERDEVVADVRSGRCRLLYVSPERIAGEAGQALRRLLAQSDLRFIAVDEAHCISQWGHDFRPEYRQLGALREEFPGVSLHAFTATATERVRADIVSELRLRDPAVLVGSFDRPNLTYRVLRRGHLKSQLMDVLARHDEEAGIVYCSSRREVEALADWLKDEGLRALPYNAALDDAVRARNQESFLEERADIVVATVAFGMGIDRSNVRFVVHAGAPRSLEHYQQEAGRAGRDGLEAECVLISSAADFVRWKMMLEQNGELTDGARTLLRQMERYATGVGCRHRHLASYFGDTYAAGECGACDVCLGELEAVPDPVPVARKILSCVARVGQRFGVMHVTNVLRGQGGEQVVSRGHDRLSTFGLLRDEPATAVRTC